MFALKDFITLTTAAAEVLEFKDILWNVSQMITKTVPIDAKIIKSCSMKRRIPLWVWREVNRNWDDNNMDYDSLLIIDESVIDENLY